MEVEKLAQVESDLISQLLVPMEHLVAVTTG